MRIVLFTCYCLGWLIIACSGVATLSIGLAVFLWGVVPPWLFILLGFNMEAVWERHDTAVLEGTVLLLVASGITVVLVRAQVWFARRVGFRFPFQSPPPNPHAHENHRFSL